MISTGLQCCELRALGMVGILSMKVHTFIFGKIPKKHDFLLSYFRKCLLVVVVGSNERGNDL